MIEWREDVLGDEFECTDLDLGEDDEGPLAATLVRALPAERSWWQRLVGRTRMLEDVDVLYVHGWSDYFFQKHLARFYTDRGARFFALDLRKYGRSLREGQTHGYIDHLSDYDTEIDLALEIIRTGDRQGASGERIAPTHRRLLLLGHSTGGLILSLWADRHPGAADALILNSPWLELQLTGVARKALAGVVGLRAKFTPHDLALPQLDMGFYAQAQSLTCDDTEIAGINYEWRPQRSPQVRAGWLNAVLAGHQLVSERLDVGIPVCVLLSARSQFGIQWDDAMLAADTVLEVEGVARSSLLLGSEVTVHRIDGALHDVFLSQAEARAEAFVRMENWLLGWNAVIGNAK